MGLDTSHGCWHGSYSGFGAFRTALFKAAFGEPESNERYAYLSDVDAWEKRNPEDPRLKDPILVLLMHSDCDGLIEVDKQLALAERLEALAGKLPLIHAEDAVQFSRGLREAHAAGEPVLFR